MSKKNKHSKKYLTSSKTKKSSAIQAKAPSDQKLKLNLPTDTNTNIPQWQKVLRWIDENILLILTGFLFAFIPLYPKLPLADLIPGYIVRLRLEDLFVGFTVLLYGIQVLRKKAAWKSLLSWLILAYAMTGILSTASGIWLTKTIPAQPLHIAKSLLHYFRYLEYFSLFFVAFSSVKQKKDIQILLAIFLTTVVAITVYGYGQKFFYWPVYSTMNREFSKGLRLYLTEHARVQSTFGGHYDMAAYLVVALPVLLALFFNISRKIFKLLLGIGFISGTWLLIMSASRTSFLAYILGISVVLFLLALSQKTWKSKIKWGISRSFLTYVLVMYMFFHYGESIYERFLQTLAAYPELHDSYHYWNDKRRHFYRDAIQPILTGEGAPYGIMLALNFSMPHPTKPDNAISTDELEQILVSSDERPVATRPADVYVDVPDIIYETTISGGIATTTTIEKPREYSDNALQHGLSLAIRLDTLWPQAIAGFMKNPLLGSGYATLTKSSVEQFTEAESTDNNFLRTLGETGALGFVTFYGVIAVAIFYASRLLRHEESDLLLKSLAIGYIGASLGLLLNAAYIDVYASSKVAFTYWILTGMVMGVVRQKREVLD